MLGTDQMDGSWDHRVWLAYCGLLIHLSRLIDRSPEHLTRLFGLPEWGGVTETAKDLVTKLLEPDPMKRLNADEALQHPWIALKGAQDRAHTLHPCLCPYPLPVVSTYYFLLSTYSTLLTTHYSLITWGAGELKTL